MECHDVETGVINWEKTKGTILEDLTFIISFS